MPSIVPALVAYTFRSRKTAKKAAKEAQGEPIGLKTKLMRELEFVVIATVGLGIYLVVYGI